MEVTFELAARMLLVAWDMTGIPDRVPGTSSRQRAYADLNRALHSGAALRCFSNMVKAQGGNARVVDDYSLLPRARYQAKAVAPRSGYVQEIDTLKVGMLSVELGAGRARKEDRVDPAVGFWFRRKIGDWVVRGEVLVEVLANHRNKGREIAGEMQACYHVGKTRPRPPKLILERIGTADKRR